MTGCSPREMSRARCLAAVLLLACAALLSGCVSKAKAKAREREAFIAGQQRALLQMQNQNRGLMVTIMGPVRNSTLPWTVDLTLAKALLAAQYYGPGDPTEVVLIRSGEARHISVQQLLSGNDVPLQPQDIIQVKPPGQGGSG
jgi:hypothetical protein